MVFRRAGGHVQFLLVTAKTDPSEWIFPKGHVEKGESPTDAARREVAEEAGVEGEIVASLGALTFTTRGTPLHVEFFLLEYRGNVPPVDRRQVEWLSYEEALRRLTFAEARELLATAASRIRPLGSATPSS